METIAVIKVDNIEQHYNSKHALKFVALQGEERVKKASNFKKKLSSQQNIFVKMDSASEKAIKGSYVVSQIITKRMKPFSDAKYIKECLNAAIVDVVCPEKKGIFNSVILGNNTITRRVEDLSSNLKKQLHHVAGNLESFALALDERTDISDIAQLCIFVRGIDTEFNVTEDLLSLRPMRGTRTGDDIFRECNSALTEANLSYEIVERIVREPGRGLLNPSETE